MVFAFCWKKSEFSVSTVSGVDRDAVLAPLGSERTCQVDDTALCCMIRCGAGDLIAYQAIHGSDIDDTAVLSRDHGLLCDSAGNAESSEKVDLHFILELRIRDIFSRSNSARTGIVDHDIDAAEFLKNSVNDCVDILCICNVAAAGHCLNAEFVGDFLCDLLDQILAACNSNDISALVRKRFRHLNTESA